MPESPATTGHNFRYENDRETQDHVKLVKIEFSFASQDRNSSRMKCSEYVPFKLMVGL